MADEYILKSYDGGAEKTTLASPFTTSGTTLTVANGSSFPDGSSGPFVIVVDRGLSSEEKFLIDTTSGTNGTIFTIQQAGYDGTTVSNHSTGASVEHCLDAFSIEQANRYVNLQTAKGDVVAHNGTTTVKVAVGTNNQALVADSAQASGIKWGQIQTAGIADNAITTGKLGDLSVTTEKLAAASVTSEKIAAGAIPAAVPSGVVSAFAGATEPSGWLLCDGRSVSRTTYANLFTALGGAASPYGGVTATNFNLPDLRTRVPVGFFSTDSDTDPTGTNNALNSLGKTGGSKVHTLVWNEMPNHDHGPGADIQNRGANYIIQGQSQSAAEGWGLSATATIGARAATSTATAGGSLAHNNLQPYIVMNYIIKV